MNIQHDKNVLTLLGHPRKDIDRFKRKNNTKLLPKRDGLTDTKLVDKLIRTKAHEIPQLLPRLSTDFAQISVKGNLTRKRRQHQRQKAKMVINEKQLQDLDIEKWLKITGRFSDSELNIREKRALKTWFDRLDRDKSGEIDSQELADPLLSTGLARSMSEVNTLFKSIDQDKSNGVGFDEFVSAMKRKNNLSHGLSNIKLDQKRKQGPVKSVDLRRKNYHDKNQPQAFKNERSLNPIIQLTERVNVNVMDTSSSLCLERRKLLLDATMGEAERRQRAFQKVDQWREDVKRMDGFAKTKKLREISGVIHQLEVNKLEKQKIVAAMEGVLERLKEDGNKDSSNVVRRIKTTREKESIRKRNVNMLAQDTMNVSRTGGRLALAYPRTREPSIPSLVGISRNSVINKISYYITSIL